MLHSHHPIGDHPAMRKFTLLVAAAASAVLVLTGVAGGVALAEQTPSCATAIIAATAATDAHAAAVKADVAAASAVRDDEAAANTKDAHKAAVDAQFTFSLPPYSDAATEARVLELQANLDNPAWVSVKARIAAIRAVLDAAVARDKAAATAVLTDADQLRREANKTDQFVLGDKAADAVAAADKACKGRDAIVTTTPPTTPNPAPVVLPSFTQVGQVPTGGVETGA